MWVEEVFVHISLQQMLLRFLVRLAKLGFVFDHTFCLSHILDTVPDNY